MHIGEFVANYLLKNKISQRQFAKECGLSNGYISMLINNTNPRTGKPLVPSLTALLSLAKGMKITIDELIAETDDIDVDISLARNIPRAVNKQTPAPDLSESERVWIELYRKLSPEVRETFVTLVEKFDALPDGERQMLLAMIRGAIGAQAE